MIGMATAGMVDARSERIEEYVTRFGEPPPLLYMLDLSDEKFAARVAEAIKSGKAIDASEFDGQANQFKTIY